MHHSTLSAFPSAVIGALGFTLIGLLLMAGTMSVSQAAILCPNNKPRIPCTLAEAFETCETYIDEQRIPHYRRCKTPGDTSCNWCGVRGSPPVYVTIYYWTPWFTPGWTWLSPIYWVTGEAPDTHKNLGHPDFCPVGNPINQATGNKFQVETDYRSPLPGGLEFRRYYNSLAPTYGSLGTHWRGSYDRRLDTRYHESTLTRVRADGKREVFWQALEGGWQAESGTGQRLEALETEPGVLSGWAYYDRNDTREVYDLEGRLVSLTARGGHTQTLHYDVHDRLVTVSGPFGRTLRFDYDDANRLIAMTDPAGGQYRYDYDAQGNLVAVHYPDETMRQYRYEDPQHEHALTGLIDENATRLATWSYDPQGRAVSAEHTGGVGRVTLDYRSDGTTTVVDALGATRSYQFNTRAGVIRPKRIVGDQCSGCGASAPSFDYNAEGLLEARRDHNGNVTRYAYNARGLEISRAEAADTPQARTITTEWHPEYRLPVRIDAPGKYTEFAYDENGRLLARSEHDTTTGAVRRWTYTYTAAGLLDTVDGPRTDVADLTDHDYDAQGNRIRSTNALGQITEITAHDVHGRPLNLIDANGVTTRLAYDARGRLSARIVGESAQAARTTFAYDDAGQLTRLTLPNGASLDYAYDEAQRLIAIQDAMGNRIEYTLDALGNRTSESVYDAQGTLRRTHAWVYDRLGRMIETLGASARGTVYEYDANGNRTTITDALGRVTTQGFDALDRLIRVTDSLGGISINAYDAADRPTSVTDPRGLTTHYRYDGFGNLLELDSPDTGTTVYTYDAAGNRLTQTDARGVTTDFRYDALNRLIAIEYPDASLNVAFDYDQGHYGIGRLTGMSDASGTTTYTYDMHGNRITETKTLLGVEYTTRYAYDLAGNLRQITYPSGRTVDYARDVAGRVIEVTTSFDGVTQMIAAAIAYLPFGPLQSLNHGNGLTHSDSYDLDYRLTQRSVGAVQTLTYSYDAVGNIETLSDLLDTSRSQSFHYDLLDRLVSAQGLYGTLDYGYDALGNRVSLSAASGTDTYSYDDISNRLLSISGSNVRSFGYDAAGNTVQAGNALYLYNASNRLAQANQGTQSASYIYNGKGERVIKTVGTQTTVFHYDSNGHLLAESDSGGVVLREYLYLEGRRLAIVVGERQSDGDVYTFQGATKDGSTNAVLNVNLSDRSLQLNDSAGREFSHRFDEQHWKVEHKPKHTIVRFTHDKAIKLKGHLIVHHQGDDDASNDTARANLRILQPEECRLLVRYRGVPGQFQFTATDIKSSEPITTALTLDDRRLTITFADGEKSVFEIEKKNWKVRHIGQHRTRIDFSYDDGHSSLNGSLRLNKHKTVATLRLRQGQRYRAVYKAMIGQAQAPVNSAFSIYHIHTDHLDTPQVITDADQQIVWRGDKKPFGETTVTVDTIDNPLRFPGQYYDNETGLHYNYFRDYGPVTGRYNTADPMGILRGGDLNIYHYVKNNPIRWIDPFGLLTFGLGFSGSFQSGGAGASVSVAAGFDTSYQLCFQFTTCGRVGPGASGGAGLNVSVGEKSFCNGNSFSAGAFFEGGSGPVFGGGSAEYGSGGKSGSVSFKGGLGAGAAGGAQVCIARTKCF